MSKAKRASARAGARHAGTPVRPARYAAFAIGCGLVLLNVAVYAAVRHFELVNWDDSTYVTENPTVLGGLSWTSAWWALTTGHSPYWHPMTWLSHLLDITLFGSDTGMYHLTNLVIHIANTVLVFEFFRRATTAVGRSAFVAAIFAVHPLHVESVAWIAERKDVLSTLFWVLTLLAYVAYVWRPAAIRYAVMLVVFGLALMSKPMVVTLPAVLLLLDVWPLGRLNAGGAGNERDSGHAWPRLILEKLPLLVLALATSVATIVVQNRVGAMANLAALPWQDRAANATIGYVAYIGKTIWPSRLAAFYPLFDISATRVAAAALVLLAATATAMALRKRYPFVVVGWLWYLVTIAPVIGLLQAGEQGMADRFMYVPMIGLLIIVAWGAPVICNRFRRTVPLAAAGVVLACAVTARAQVAHWANSVELWQHATRVTPGSYIAHENLGQALRERGQLADAQASYQRALKNAPARSPGYLAVIHNSLGLVSIRAGHSAEALDHFAAAVKLNPAFAEAQSNLGNGLAAAGHLDEAIECYREAVRLKPDYTEPRVGLGGALLRAGNAADAIPQYREALRLDPNLAEAHNGLGGALAMTGQDGAAMTQYAEALRLKPELPTAHLNIALLFIKKGDVAQARHHLETALSIDPGYLPAQQALRAITPGS
ncbi:MAG: tetratricopeptide repeat protein [Vicinamibacterales bacterium]